MARCTFILIALTIGAALASPPVAAKSATRAMSVKVCSSYGNGCYAAPIRDGRYGPEMRLHGGTWIDCRGDCREALREETVDFWETQNDKAQAIH
jgi:hypothetical protein